MQTFHKDIDAYSQLPKGELVSASIDYAGNIIILMAIKPTDYRDEQSSGASFAKTIPEQSQTYQIWQAFGEWDGELFLQAEITAKVNFHAVQRFSNGDVLLICGRSHYRSHNDYDKNGYLYTADGHLKKQILLGDGIESTQVTKDGVIWTGFFDEGVFGNYGWHNPVGKSGLVAWTSEGDKAYEFEATGKLQEICDCYALNVVSDNLVYCYYYTEFDLVQIKNHQITDYWHMPIAGSHAFINYANKAIFTGGYDDNYDSNSFYLVELSDKHQANVIKQIILKFNNENILQNGEYSSFAFGRGDIMLVIKGKDIFRSHFAEFLS